MGFRIDNAKSIDLLNIGLIFISLLIAFKLPFELFLFSYAVLGPLHYFTEINWLERKNYYVKERKWIWVLVLLALLITLPVVLKMPEVLPYESDGVKKMVGDYGSDMFYSILFIAFLFSICLVYLKKWLPILLVFIGTLGAVLLVLKFKLFSFALLCMFLPTIVHVYLFTLLFMVYGNMKTGSKFGFLGSAILLLVPFVIWGSVIDPEHYHITQGVQTTFFKSDFQNVDANIARFFGAVGGDGKFYLASAAGIKIQIFVAFCYTYHYLNWFSKTSIIGWGKNMSKTKVILIGCAWVGAVGLYWYDYRIGFAALFTISLIHVFFEFPLNVISVQGIIKGVAGGSK